MEKSLKLRHWYLGEIYRAGNSSVKLESVRETARRFGVAQCTVSGVTSSLIREGWLIPKKGIGIYTNPQKLAGDSSRKLIGFINGDGRMFYYNSESFTFFSSVGSSLLEKGCNFRNIQLESSTPEGIAQELLCSGTSSIIWCARDVLIPESVLKAVSEAGIRIVCDIPGCGYFPVVREDFEFILKRWSQWIRKHGIKKMLIYLMPWHCRCFSAYFKKENPELKLTAVCIGSALPPNEEENELILTDSSHLSEAGKHAKNWREDPGNGSVYLPDHETISKAFAEELFSLHLKKEKKIQPITKRGVK